MFFHTPEFFGLLAVSLALYYFAPNRRLIVLAVADLLFYSVAGAGNAALFVVMTAITYYCSRHVRGRYGSLFLWFGIGLNVLNLAFFKYAVFLIRTVEKALSVKLLTTDSFLLEIALPIGISFYTFQMIAYLVDIRKGKWEPAQSLLHFWVFISFFAHSIAGPIMRGHEFMPQIDAVREIRFRADRFKLGAAWFALGLAKKIVFADYLSRAVDSFYDRAVWLTGPEAWVASYLFAFQIFFDFAAYSEMAVGIGYMFGFELPFNFRSPYVSANATEFWRRWHITLSNWIRDYIYIPLGGSRKGPVRQYANLFAAMTISGVWHGAAWTFVAWGAYHGALLALHKLYMAAKEKLGLTFLDNSKLYRLFAIIVFFHLTCIGWVLFRVPGFTNALAVLKKMIRPEAFLFPKSLLPFLLAAAGLFLLHFLEYYALKHAGRLHDVWHRKVPAPVRAMLYTLIIAAIVVFIQNDQNAFIYFQF